MEKINVAELLRNCPKGMELDCTMYENCTFDGLKDFDELMEPPYPIKVQTPDGRIGLNKYGCYTSNEYSKCVIFPIGKTTWEGFVPPYKFKDGDIIYNRLQKKICIYFLYEDEVPRIRYCRYNESNIQLQFEKLEYPIPIAVQDYRLATEEEKERLFDAIKANGYKWNPKTKTLEKLIKPKFKVGDKIQCMDYKVKITEVNIEDECYEYESIFAKGIGGIAFSEQDNWELVPDIKPKFKVGDVIQHKENTGWVCTIARVADRYYVEGHPTCYSIPFDKQDEYELIINKFDITTLKPFESRVLVRDYNDDIWRPAIFGAIVTATNYNDLPFVVVGGSFYDQCIPYEGNEHLSGTTNNCDEFYKNW